MPRVKSGAVVATARLRELAPDFRRAELRLEGLKPPVETFSVRFFADEKHPSAATPVDENPRLLGTLHLYGLGVPNEDAEHTEVRLNITEGLRAYLAQSTSLETPISLVAVDRRGIELAEPDLDFESIIIVTA